jgi:hypothetical protein
MRLFAVILISVLIGQMVSTDPAASQEHNALILAGDDFNERFSTSTQFSGVSVAGFYVHAETDQDTPFLRILVSRNPGSRAYCVRVVSANGFYEAANTYFLPENFAGGVGIIPFSTKQPKRLLDVDGRELGVAVFEDQCQGGDGPQKMVPAFWNADPEAPDASVSLAVNSVGAERVLLYLGSTGTVVVCEPFSRSLRLSFDTLCNFDLSAIPAGEDTVLRIVAVADNRPQAEIEVIVYLPDRRFRL